MKHTLHTVLIALLTALPTTGAHITAQSPGIARIADDAVLAVFDFTSETMTDESTQEFSTLLQQAMIEKARAAQNGDTTIIVLPAGEMQERLRLGKLDDIRCTTLSCALTIAQGIGATQAVFGTLDESNGYLVITAERGDTETRERMLAVDMQRRLGEADYAALADYIAGELLKSPNMGDTGALTVTGVPDGATVYVDGVLAGSSPVLNYQVAAGSHTVVVTKRGFGSDRMAVTVFPGKPATAEYSLGGAAATITVTGYPQDARVLLDNRFIGTTPIEGLGVPSGEYELTIARTDFQTYTQMVAIEPNTHEKVAYALKAAGLVSVMGAPLNAAVTIDSRNAGMSPIKEYPVMEGGHTIKVSMSGYENAVDKVSVKTNEITLYRYDLQPKTRSRVILRSAFLPGWGQWYGERFHTSRMITYAQMAAIGLVIGTWYYVDMSEAEYESAYKNYYNANENFDAHYSVVTQKHGTVVNAYLMRNVAFGVALAVYGFNMYDAFSHDPAEIRRRNRTTTVALTPAGVTARVRF